MKSIVLFFFLIMFRFSASAQLQADTTHSNLQQDTVSSTILKDTTSSMLQRDSAVIVAPIPELGSLEPFGDTLRFITDSEITWHEYRSLYDILSSQHGLFVRDLASPGQQNQIIANGLTDRNISIMVDGIPYNDYFTGSYNLWLIPVDAIERIEYLSGAGSIFYDGKSPAGAINIITKNYNNNRAITRLRYSQGIQGYVHTDAFFAQNVLRDLNLTLGLSHYGYGSNKEINNYRGRFRNSNDDAWTFRGKLRYNITDWIDLSFFYLYNKTWTGLHGGVNYFNTLSLFDGLRATVQNSDAFEKYFNSQYNFTTAFYPFQDSSLLATLTLYAFDRLREYRDGENRDIEFRNGILKEIDYTSHTNAARFQIRIATGFNTISYYTQYRQVKKRDEVTVGIKDELNLFSLLSVTPFSTVLNSSGNNNINAGISARLILVPSLELFGGFSENIVNDFPHFSAPFAFPNTDLENQETFASKETGAQFTAGETFRSKISFQQIEQTHPVIFDTIQIPLQDNYTYNAVSASAHLAFGNFHFEGTGNYFKQPAYTPQNRSRRLYPEVTLDGSMYFHGLLSKGHLDLKVGLRGRYISQQTGMAPYDEYGVWIPSSLLSYGPSGAIDFFAIGKIGSAYVHFIWENLTGNNFLLAPVYPMYDRNIRFGLSWEFLD